MRPIVTADEMARIEKIAIEQGASDLTFMETAGQSIAEHTQQYIEQYGIEKKVLLLVGRGNNGGDALKAGCDLLQKKIKCTAWLLNPPEECSALCQMQLENYRSGGGEIIYLDKETPQFPQSGVILDGLTGTGFHGRAEGLLSDLIHAVNESALPIFSIDIPSGLNGTTGDVETVAIHADQTLYLCLPKLGFFINSGWNHVGELCPIDFGLEPKYIDQADHFGHLAEQEQVASLLPPIQRNRHKYQAGYVIAIAGSPGMCGAGLLASYAALRSGCGIIRLFYPYGLEAELANAPYELVREGWDFSDRSRILEESKRAGAFIIGPGIGRHHSTGKMLKQLIPSLTKPTVIDADGLYHLANNPRWTLPANLILTPHHQEMARILGENHTDDQSFLNKVRTYAKERALTVVLKGAPTWIFHKDHSPLMIPRGDPGMATAGSGDVLSGIIAAFLSQGLDCAQAALLGTYLHALAGECAALEKTSYSMIASDIIEELPEAILLL